jgi:acetyl-CoA acetyltransferase
VSLRGKVAIAGVAESDLGEVAPGLSELDLIAQASVRALADAGLTKDDVDGLFVSSLQYPTPTLHAAEYLGIRPAYSDSSNIGGAAFVLHLLHALAAIESGVIETALIAYGSTMRSSGGYATTNRLSPYEEPYRPRWPVSMYALVATRHMHQYGTTREQLAQVAVAARRWAQLNPSAFMRDELTVDDVLSSRMISSPLTVRDCCLVTDGGGAVVVTSAERARSLAKDPVFVLGAAEAQWNRDITSMPDLTVTAASESGARAFAMAGLGPTDVDVVEVYDAFTINTILFLEDLGFCAKGEGGDFVAAGNIAPGGALAVNTNGGGLSYCHPGMYGIFLIIEAVRQLRGEAGERQQENANVAAINGNGGVLSSQATAILGTESTL